MSTVRETEIKMNCVKQKYPEFAHKPWKCLAYKIQKEKGEIESIRGRYSINRQCGH